MKKTPPTISTKIKYFGLGIFVYLSIISIFASSPSIGSDGKFGDYFVRITGICSVGDVIVGYDTSISAYGTKNCTSLKTLFGNVFGSSIPPADSSLVGFGTPAGALIYKENIWKTNANGISYTGSRVGIGTSTPGTTLDVVTGDININPVGGGNIIIGASNVGIVKISDMNASYFNGGNVGIGTSTPMAQLEVVGNTKISTQLTTQYIELAGQPLKIPVVCTGQGKGLHWDGTNWSCIAMPVEGTCNNAVANTCTYGTPSGYNAGTCGGNATWTCNGVNGGTDASCSKTNPPCPVNGVCNNSTQYSCSVGVSINNNTGSCGGNTTWSCQGSNGGTDASCSKANAACLEGYGEWKVQSNTTGCTNITTGNPLRDYVFCQNYNACQYAGRSAYWKCTYQGDGSLGTWVNSPSEISTYPCIGYVPMSWVNSLSAPGYKYYKGYCASTGRGVFLIAK